MTNFYLLSISQIKQLRHDVNNFNIFLNHFNVLIINKVQITCLHTKYLGYIREALLTDAL